MPKQVITQIKEQVVQVIEQAFAVPRKRGPVEGVNDE
jgi:hypothetical protein